MHHENLAQLAEYLETEAKPEHFDMSAYQVDSLGRWISIGGALAKHECGTAACAAGHGPHAGIPIPAGVESWDAYTEAVFGASPFTPTWIWLFDDRWSNTDDTPTGAAKRIHHFLQHGVPEDFGRQIRGQGYLFA